MKGRIIKTFAAVITLMILCRTSVFAAPKTMADGGVFDPEYYAQQNPDVVAALGADENALYQHYLNNGKSEGRLPYEVNISAATVTRTRKYMFNSVTARNSLMQRFVKFQCKNNIVTLQEMSDGTINITQTAPGKKAYVFTNTGSTGGLSSGYMYINTASSDGTTGNVRLMYDDTVIGLMYLDSEGYFSHGETYYEGIEY